MITTADKYNKIYSENTYTFGGKPVSTVVAALNYLKSGKALDLGAGQGRNSIFLASHGFKVRAIDVSEKGIEMLNESAEEMGLDIKAEVADITQADLDSDYDLIVSTYVLHHLEREKAIQLINRIKHCTVIDGLNVITAFTKNGDFYRSNPDTKNFHTDEQELKFLYEGWEVLQYDEIERKAFDKNPDGTPKLNFAARILARKIK